MNKPLIFLLSLTFLFLFSGSVYGGDFQDGVEAYQGKDYKEAVRWYRLSAEQGYALAQLVLGLMYVEGKGVRQDYKEAAKWYRLAAEQGDTSAQFSLGLMYVEGKGVPQDYVLAHMWFNLSAYNGEEDGAEARSRVEKKMSPSQIEKAQEMARNWKPKK